MYAYVIIFTILLSSTPSVFTILGGHDVTINQVPHHVNYGDVCGGVLIHKKWAITTAHCGAHDFIRIGSRHRVRGLKVTVVFHLVHPWYGLAHEYDFDVQLLELKRSLLFSRTVAAVAMCDGNCGGDILVTGWGYPIERGDYKEILQQVELKIVSFSHCQGVGEFWYNHTLTSRMFCAGDEDRDACQGDSGGGAVSRAGLAGLSSFGVGCGRFPGVYINTSHRGIRTWINEHTGL